MNATHLLYAAAGVLAAGGAALRVMPLERPSLAGGLLVSGVPARYGIISATT